MFRRWPDSVLFYNEKKTERGKIANGGKKKLLWETELRLFSRGIRYLCHDLMREAVKVIYGKSLTRTGWAEGEAGLFWQVVRPSEDKVGYKKIWSQWFPDDLLLLIS